MDQPSFLPPSPSLRQPSSPVVVSNDGSVVLPSHLNTATAIFSPRITDEGSLRKFLGSDDEEEGVEAGEMGVNRFPNAPPNDVSAESHGNSNNGASGSCSSNGDAGSIATASTAPTTGNRSLFQVHNTSEVFSPVSGAGNGGRGKGIKVIVPYGQEEKEGEGGTWKSSEENTDPEIERRRRETIENANSQEGLKALMLFSRSPTSSNHASSSFNFDPRTTAAAHANPNPQCSANANVDPTSSLSFLPPPAPTPLMYKNLRGDGTSSNPHLLLNNANLSLNQLSSASRSFNFSNGNSFHNYVYHPDNLASSFGLESDLFAVQGLEPVPTGSNLGHPHGFSPVPPQHNLLTGNVVSGRNHQYIQQRGYGYSPAANGLQLQNSLVAPSFHNGMGGMRHDNIIETPSFIDAMKYVGGSVRIDSPEQRGAKRRRTTTTTARQRFEDESDGHNDYHDKSSIMSFATSDTMMPKKEKGGGNGAGKKAKKTAKKVPKKKQTQQDAVHSRRDFSEFPTAMFAGCKASIYCEAGSMYEGPAVLTAPQIPSHQLMGQPKQDDSRAGNGGGKRRRVGDNGNYSAQPQVENREPVYAGEFSTIALLPDFYNVVNFPSHVVKKRPRSDRKELSRRCVMCGSRCLLATKETKRKNAGKETADDPTTLHSYLMRNFRAISSNRVEEDGVDLTGLGDSGPVIPTQNKGLCSLCDRAIWVYHVPAEDQIPVPGTEGGEGSGGEKGENKKHELVSAVPIKWCKGCKNFREWEAFGTKGRATKCERCRVRQRTQYASNRDGGMVNKKVGAVNRSAFM